MGGGGGGEEIAEASILHSTAGADCLRRREVQNRVSTGRRW